MTPRNRRRDPVPYRDLVGLRRHDGRRKIRPYEVPISYRARGREEDKKITWKDGVEALWILGRERARKR